MLVTFLSKTEQILNCPHRAERGSYRHFSSMVSPNRKVTPKGGRGRAMPSLRSGHFGTPFGLVLAIRDHMLDKDSLRESLSKSIGPPSGGISTYVRPADAGWTCIVIQIPVSKTGIRILESYEHHLSKKVF